MSIRPATAADLPRLVELGAALHAESPRWGRIPLNYDKCAKALADMIAGADSAVFVAERNGVVIGGIAGVIQEHWACDARVAHEASFFVTPEYRGTFAACRLICTLVAWARCRKAAWLFVGTSTGVHSELTARLYERLGAERCAIGLEFDLS